MVRSRMSREYQTKHLGEASFLRYVLGDAAHLATESVDQRSCVFTFDDTEGRCRELAAMFFSKQGAAVSDARVLLEIKRDVTRTSALAYADPHGVWEPEQKKTI